MKKRYTILHRYLSGLTVFCVIVTIVGSTLAGTTTFTWVCRSLAVAACLLLTNRVIIKIWASWEEIQHAAVTQSDE
ncbi:MAG: hypothetical protein KDD69_13250 [Bdellovibrionales bacterium]|nr:hypothetical protein [Bdellovibrionales bacterium]